MYIASVTIFPSDCNNRLNKCETGQLKIFLLWFSVFLHWMCKNMNICDYTIQCWYFLEHIVRVVSGICCHSFAQSSCVDFDSILCSVVLFSGWLGNWTEYLHVLCWQNEQLVGVLLVFILNTICFKLLGIVVEYWKRAGGTQMAGGVGNGPRSAAGRWQDYHMVSLGWYNFLKNPEQKSFKPFTCFVYGKWKPSDGMQLPE